METRAKKDKAQTTRPAILLLNSMHVVRSTQREWWVGARVGGWVDGCARVWRMVAHLPCKACKYVAPCLGGTLPATSCPLGRLIGPKRCLDLTRDHGMRCGQREHVHRIRAALVVPTDACDATRLYHDFAAYRPTHLPMAESFVHLLALCPLPGRKTCIVNGTCEEQCTPDRAGFQHLVGVKEFGQDKLSEQTTLAALGEARTQALLSTTCGHARVGWRLSWYGSAAQRGQECGAA